MKVIKEQSLTPTAVYVTCKREKLLSCGSYEHYKTMHDMVANLPKDSKIPTDSLYQIADFIASHSDFELWAEKENDASVDYDNFVEHIMKLLYQSVVTDFYVIQ